ncbi:unnamed protein product [Dracunculus medinensis]|uniref:SGNH domain-containing protein n=1 Tax=Dracunculus medinensis TaxID=318479 RepID=A0A0N4UJ02_DRAME|nr:unnamed protein product [Dracunculus medinensis]
MKYESELTPKKNRLGILFNEVILSHKTDLPVDKSFIRINTRDSSDLSGYYHRNGTIRIAIIGNSYSRSSLYMLNKILGDNIEIIQVFCHIKCFGFWSNLSNFCKKFMSDTLEKLRVLKPHLLFLISTAYDANRFQSLLDTYSSLAERIIINYPFPILMRGSKNITATITRKLLLSYSINDIYIKYEEFWETFKDIFHILNSMKCYKCIRVYPHKMLCNNTVKSGFARFSAAVSFSTSAPRKRLLVVAKKKNGLSQVVQKKYKRETTGLM